MKAWMVGGVAAVTAGVAVYNLLPRKALTPAGVPEAAPVVIAPAPVTHPPEPAPLPAVVDVTDIRDLLDPPAPPPEPPPTPGVIAVGYEEPFPMWKTGNWYVYPDPRSRFADPSDPDRPPYPPDDYAARVLAPPPRPAAPPVEVAPAPRPVGP